MRCRWLGVPYYTHKLKDVKTCVSCSIFGFLTVVKSVFVCFCIVQRVIVVKFATFVGNATNVQLSIKTLNCDSLLQSCQITVKPMI